MIVFFAEHGEGRQSIEDIKESMDMDIVTVKNCEKKARTWEIPVDVIKTIVAEHLFLHKQDFIS